MIRQNQESPNLKNRADISTEDALTPTRVLESVFILDEMNNVHRKTFLSILRYMH